MVHMSTSKTETNKLFDKLEDFGSRWMGRPIVARYTPDPWTLVLVFKDGGVATNPVRYAMATVFEVGGRAQISVDAESEDAGDVFNALEMRINK
jgi:hypothetical protein